MKKLFAVLLCLFVLLCAAASAQELTVTDNSESCFAVQGSDWQFVVYDIGSDYTCEVKTDAAALKIDKAAIAEKTTASEDGSLIAKYDAPTEYMIFYGPSFTVSVTPKMNDLTRGNAPDDGTFRDYTDVMDTEGYSYWISKNCLIEVRDADIMYETYKMLVGMGVAF